MKHGKQTVNIIDFLGKAKRGPQVVLPKDASALVGLTGVSSGWSCFDAGAGSGWLCSFLGNLVKPSGRVVSYEKDERWVSVAKETVKACGLEKTVIVKKGDVTKAPELKKACTLDLITLDMKEPELVVLKAAKALKPGGFLAVFSPHIEQQKRTVAEIKKSKQLERIKTIEVIQRSWQVNEFTHPEISGLLHTCFLTVARKKF